MTTAFGTVTLTRMYTVGGADGGEFPADQALGLDGFLTLQSRRMITRVGVHNSFAKARGVLQELCGWSPDDETIRLATHAEATRARKERPERVDATRFAEAAGTVEVPIDAGKVNTLEGWRDVKIALFLRREAGNPATPAEWDTRRLPPPSIRVGIAAIENSDEFAKRVRAEADRLNATLADAVTVLGDGAVLDIFHANEHLAATADALHGKGTAPLGPGSRRPARHS